MPEIFTTATVKRQASAQTPVRAEVLRYTGTATTGDWEPVRHFDIRPGLYEVIDLAEGEALRIHDLAPPVEERPMAPELKG